MAITMVRPEGCPTGWLLRRVFVMYTSHTVNCIYNITCPVLVRVRIILFGQVCDQLWRTRFGATSPRANKRYDLTRRVSESRLCVA